MDLASLFNIHTSGTAAVALSSRRWSYAPVELKEFHLLLSLATEQGS